MDLQRGKMQPRTINTRHILFIVSGAFDKLGEIVRRRIASRPIGFQEADVPEDLSSDEILDFAAAQDFIEYGFEPEFIGRLPIRVPCRALTVDDLEQILISGEESVLEQYREDFRGYGMEFDITREALREVAVQAAEEQTGARGLMTVLERLFRLYKFELPSTRITHFEVTTDTMADPAGALSALLVDERAGLRSAMRADIEAYAERFRKASGMDLVFTAPAMEALVGMSIESDKTVRALCEERFKDFEFGLRLVADKRGITSFTVTPEVVADPDRELSKWVMDNFPQDRETPSAHVE
jgi:ATP-dependent protease Clp ATPase subunit